jgi:hypothetical protein
MTSCISSLTSLLKVFNMEAGHLYAHSLKLFHLFLSTTNLYSSSKKLLRQVYLPLTIAVLRFRTLLLTLANQEEHGLTSTALNSDGSKHQVTITQ